MRTETIIHFDQGTDSDEPLFDSPERHLFRTNDLIAGVSEKALADISRHIEIVHCAPDEIIFAENEEGDCLYLIAQGSVKISKKGRAGQQEVLTYLMERDFFGEMALVDSGPRSAQASAHGHTILGRVNRQAWSLLFQVAPQEVLGNFTRAVTKRLRQNNQNFIEQMLQTERLSLLGTTTASIVHDMNNPLACILSACEVMQTQIQDDLAARMTTIIREAVDRMEAMSRELLDFSRGTTRLVTAPLPISELLEGMAQDLQKCEQAGIEVTREILDDGEIRIDLHRMLRVFGNLIRNAREAMKRGPGSKLLLRVVREGSDVCFQLRDNGCGIPAEFLPRVFEPFLTLGKAKGTGLGLAISKAIVEGHAGKISVTSVQGAGTSFLVRLPACV